MQGPNDNVCLPACLSWCDVMYICNLSGHIIVWLAGWLAGWLQLQLQL